MQSQSLGTEKRKGKRPGEQYLEVATGTRAPVPPYKLIITRELLDAA